MYKIAHISDLHISSVSKDLNIIIFEKLLRDIVSIKCNHLVISGDITNNATEEEYDMINMLLKKYDYFDSDKLTVCIGNHDIYGGGTKSENSFMFPFLCKQIDYKKSLIQFQDNFLYSFTNSVVMKRNNYFPNLKILNNEIAIISLNSIPEWSHNLNPAASNGKVSNTELKDFEILLKSDLVKNKLKIVIIHHHFNEPKIDKNNYIHSLWLYSEKETMKLHNAKILLKIFNKYDVDIVMHGHTHITNTYKIGKQIFINSSGCIMPFTEEIKYKYYIIEFQSKNSNFKIQEITLK
jgi:3',5'-cyclic AMP phosphodiesterase CpdA